MYKKIPATWFILFFVRHFKAMSCGLPVCKDWNPLVMAMVLPPGSVTVPVYRMTADGTGAVVCYVTVEWCRKRVLEAAKFLSEHAAKAGPLDVVLGVTEERPAFEERLTGTAPALERLYALCDAGAVSPYPVLRAGHCVGSDGYQDLQQMLAVAVRALREMDTLKFLHGDFHGGNVCPPYVIDYDMSVVPGMAIEATEEAVVQRLPRVRVWAFEKPMLKPVPEEENAARLHTAVTGAVFIESWDLAFFTARLLVALPEAPLVAAFAAEVFKDVTAMTPPTLADAMQVQGPGAAALVAHFVWDDALERVERFCSAFVYK